ncbi:MULTISPECIES: potassium channel family protein [unclassified Undibacterium]|uniref:potassium channel family protein n=1 Tax=unclassified Undibacterium TaxID=2630295 RepID=UPI002AC9BB93|nr:MULTISPECIES: potassium channel family protein [unclassified Undibacterium]MEB0138328.1 potassium channel family protein [Undibacterium sp. CCC2.1]MEB0172705.1 potassium channel family protein [Undibacterium sp. CCC1.1]MEB0174703.1 potassium channel family protein [Undibacterium sp. CCC3.4]MEB0213900.1 potassium channel family protein [Undibacterium sp. 5I2]WPX42625.1 potassium channel family protein [Undibacterium sp. CCC3.4]
MKRQKRSPVSGIYPLTQQFLSYLSRPLLLLGLLISIPAFYLLLDGADALLQVTGRLAYVVVALMMGVDTFWQWHRNKRQRRQSGKMALDVLIIIGCLVSAWPTVTVWGTVEWLLRLALCGAILLRIATLVLQHMKPSYLVQMMGLAILMLSSAGAGFYWLEPNVTSYANGVWLAFTTVATVGYGDIVPSTPASKIFAVFIVLFGYAMFSIVTANIAALFVGEEEADFERELHQDIRALRRELGSLREELRSRDALLLRLEQAQQAQQAVSPD